MYVILDLLLDYLFIKLISYFAHCITIKIMRIIWAYLSEFILQPNQHIKLISHSKLL